MSAGDDDLAYVFPSDDGYACVAVSYNLADYASARTHADEAFAERIGAHPFIAERAAVATSEGRLWACGPRDAIVRHPVGPGWALVGDASMHQDPWTGNGMDFASTHAIYLAEVIDKLLSGHSSEEAAWDRYHRRRDAHGLPGWRRARRTGQGPERGVPIGQSCAKCGDYPPVPKRLLEHDRRGTVSPQVLEALLGFREGRRGARRDSTTTR